MLMIVVVGLAIYIFAVFMAAATAIYIAILPQPCVAGVSDDLQQPRTSITSSLKTRKGMQCAQKGLLHHVLGISIAASEPAREIVGRVQMRQYDLFEQLRPLCIYRVRGQSIPELFDSRQQRNMHDAHISQIVYLSGLTYIPKRWINVCSHDTKVIDSNLVSRGDASVCRVGSIARTPKRFYLG